MKYIIAYRHIANKRNVRRTFARFLAVLINPAKFVSDKMSHYQLCEIVNICEIEEEIEKDEEEEE